MDLDRRDSVSSVGEKDLGSTKNAAQLAVACSPRLCRSFYPSMTVTYVMIGKCYLCHDTQHKASPVATKMTPASAGSFRSFMVSVMLGGVDERGAPVNFNPQDHCVVSLRT